MHNSMSIRSLCKSKHPGIFRVNFTTVASKQTKEDTTPIDLETDSPSIIFTPLNVTQQKEKHDKALWFHLECQTIEKTLKTTTTTTTTTTAN